MDVLGSLSFTETPDVNLDLVLTSDNGVVSFSAGTSASQPAAGIIGRVFLNTDTNRLLYDNGAVWIDTTQVPLIDGTTDQVDVVDGTNVTPTVISLAQNPILPGTARFRPPVGTTAQRPGAPSAGDQRFNTTLGWTEEYNGAFWAPMGRILQVVTGSIPANTTTSKIQYDDSAPNTGDGAQVWSQSFTPLSTTSRVIIQWTATIASSTTAGWNSIITATFAGTTNIGSTITRVNTTNRGYAIANTISYTPGSTAPVTYSMRFGGQAGTSYINTTINGSLGGTLVSQYIITEVA